MMKRIGASHAARVAAVAVALLSALGASACSSGSDAPTKDAVTDSGGSQSETGAGEDTARAGPAERISGDFEISNTTAGGAEVLVETIAVSLETAAAEGSAWRTMPAVCSTTPTPPIRVATATKIAYQCAPATSVSSDAHRRVVVRATIAGSDETFRIVSEIPR